MHNEKSFYSVVEKSEYEQVINKSRFITTLVPIVDFDDAMEKVKEISKKYSDATHNCYAFISNTIATEQKFSDDGEPQGTAGMPMLEVLKKRSCYMTLAVVTRYFGGIKLGASGLVSAYSSSVAKALDETIVALNKYSDHLKINCDYSYYKKVEELAINNGCKILGIEYGNDVELNISVDVNDTEDFLVKLADLSLGQAKYDKIDSKYYLYI